MSKNNEANINMLTMAQQQAMAKIIGNMFLQLATSQKMLGVEEWDELKLSNIPPDIVIGLLYGKLRGELDNQRAWKKIVEYLLRLLQSIEGERAKMVIQGITSLSGGSRGNKIMKRRGWIDRRIRGKSEYEVIGDGEE